MADIGDIVVTAHSDDADDDDGMVPASGATASGATASGATASGATASKPAAMHACPKRQTGQQQKCTYRQLKDDFFELRRLRSACPFA